MNIIKTLPQNAVVGTSFRGEIHASYDELVAAFGQPYEVDGDGKVRVQWVISLNGVTVSIYDWRSTEDYYVDEEFWHVGGFKSDGEIHCELVMGCIG